MNKVVFSSDIFEIQRFGGVSRYFVELAKNLKSLNLAEVTIPPKIHINSHLSNTNLNSGICLPFSPARLKLDNLIKIFNQNQAKYFTSKKLFDVKHETFYRGGVNFLAAKSSVTTIYDLTREKFTPNWQGFKAKQDAITSADAVICISESTAKDLLNYYEIDQQKIFVIPLGVSDSFLQTKKFNLINRQLLYVGGRSGYKDFNSLVLAFSNSKLLRENLSVLVFGNRFTNEEEVFMRNLKVRKCFSLISGNEARLRDAYRESIALVITSRYEGFGLTILEAMMSKCIVITSRGGALKEVSGGFDVPFEYSNIDSLIQAITEAASNFWQNEQFKNDAQNYAREFTWEKTARKTAGLYNLVLGNG